MVNKSIKAFLVTCSVFTGTLAVLFLGILFRMIGEALGLSGNESITILFTTIFLVSYIGISMVERATNES